MYLQCHILRKLWRKIEEKKAAGAIFYSLQLWLLLNKTMEWGLNTFSLPPSKQDFGSDQIHFDAPELNFGNIILHLHIYDLDLYLVSSLLIHKQNHLLFILPLSQEILNAWITVQLPNLAIICWLITQGACWDIILSPGWRKTCFFNNDLLSADTDNMTKPNWPWESFEFQFNPWAASQILVATTVFLNSIELRCNLFIWKQTEVTKVRVRSILYKPCSCVMLSCFLSTWSLC